MTIAGNKNMNVKAETDAKVRFAKVRFDLSADAHQARYIHKYYLPQNFRTGILPVDIDGIFGCFSEDCDSGIYDGIIAAFVPDCVIQYMDLGLEKYIEGTTARQILLAIAAFHADGRAELTPEENQAAINLNVWLIDWEKDLLSRCVQVSAKMEQQVRAGDSWLTDYEIDVEVEFYMRDDDPYSEDNMPDSTDDDLLCKIKLLVDKLDFSCGSKLHRGIGDDQNNNDCHTRKEEIYNVRHCATFHELFSHMHMPLKHAGRIGRVCTDIIMRHQNGVKVDLKGEVVIAVRDAPRIREEFVLCDEAI